MLPQAELAKLYNVTRQTIRKWQNRDTPEDKSHAPVKMYTMLSPEQELIVVELRKTLLLPTDQRSHQRHRQSDTLQFS